MKYQGGYQIIDMKGLEPSTESVSPITDSEIVEKLEYAISLKKPLYITNYIDSLGYFGGGPLLMTCDASVSFFIHPVWGENGEYVASLQIQKNNGWRFMQNEA